MTVYDFDVKTADGQTISLLQYKGNVMLIVNTASYCGFTEQYKDLQNLYETYKEKGFVVLAFPCNQFGNQEPGTDEEIQTFCENYGVTFPVFSKIDVRGPNAHLLFVYLTEQIPGVFGTKMIKWNFTKFLIDRDGNPVERFVPQTNPKDIAPYIEKLL
ncbi:glutathione peroxidase [Aeribacillus pallidus]|uniref:glutathione peroxidase n=1 Tax=Aeribacillus pallidus TaxID=33936 RepID=UPI001023541C|nr:glutathione peroxidase [Aeribacillus pallidus]RZI50612.1 glutathione peroxidase [Aeribacillus pallidus]